MASPPIDMLLRLLDASPTVDLQVGACDKSRLVTRHEDTRVHDILDLSNSTHRHVSNELFPVLRCVLHPRERGEQPCPCDKRADRIDAYLMGSVLRRKSFGRL
jgi:hypothetical protein